MKRQNSMKVAQDQKLAHFGKFKPRKMGWDHTKISEYYKK